MQVSKSIKLFLGCLALLISVPAISLCSSIPKFDGRVTDRAGVFSPSETKELTIVLSNYESETTHQIAVLTVPSLGGETIESFSLCVANAWGLGRKGINNGILVTLAMNEHKSRIELGKGFENYISNARASEIIQSYMLPEFKKGRFSKGVESSLNELMIDGRKFNVSSAAHVPVSANNQRQPTR